MNKLRFMLDTDIASYGVEHRNSALRNRLRYQPPTELCISSVTAAEMLYGVRSRPITDPLRQAIHRFLGRANVLDWGLDAAEAYADIRHSLLSPSQPIGELDMMIAAHALSAGLTLVSNNTAHFERLVPPLQLENWTV